MRNDDNIYSAPLMVNEQIYFCGLPFRLDSYSGCSFGCHYCFARSAELTVSQRRARGNILPADVKYVKRCLVYALDLQPKREDASIEWLRHRAPLHWGGMSDPFQPCEEKLQISKRLMEYLNWYNYPVVISTKSTLLTEPEYLKLLKEGNYAVQISLIGDDDELLHKIEPGAPLASERLRAIFDLAWAGMWVAVRIQPLIPGSPFEERLPEFIHRLGKLGVSHILTEGYKVQQRNPEGAKVIWEACPDSITEYAAYNASSHSFETLVPTWRKWQYVKVARQVAHEAGMTYGSADNDLRDLGDVICCCGIDNVPGFQNFWQYQASQAAEIAKDKGYVTLEDMQQFWTGTKSIKPNSYLLRSLALKNKSGVTPKQCVDYWWKAGGPLSPEEMASMTRGQVDGKLAYIYKDPIPLLESQQCEQLAML